MAKNGKQDPAGRDGVEPAYADDTVARTAKPKAAAPRAKDPLAAVMPTGEVGPRNARETTSTESGGTSKGEDTSRAAGYAADLTKTSVPPPGPPVEKAPENFAGPESTTPPPKTPDSKDGPDAQALPPMRCCADETPARVARKPIPGATWPASGGAA